MGNLIIRGERFRSFLKGFFELVITVVLVLVFFSVVLGLLNRIFPTGASIKDLMASDSSLFGQQNETAGISSSPHFVGLEAQMPAPEEFTAQLTVLRNETKSKRANSIAWKSAQEGMLLYHRDSVQTFKKSSAVISFDEESFLKMGENSLVIIQRLEEDPFLKEKRSLLVMVDGELRGKIKGDGGKKIQVEVTTPSGVARISSQERSGTGTEFKITVNPDQSSTISVYNGVATVIAQNREVLIENNQASTLRMNQPPSPPVHLPDPPQLQSPGNNRVFFYKELSPQVEFSWVDMKASDEFRFLLSRDPDFKSPVVDEKVVRSRFVHGNLKEGRYYWKVSSVDGVREGAFSPIGTLEMKQDLDPPWLSVKFPPKTFDQGQYMLMGETEPGVTIFVGGQEIPTTQSGQFNMILKLQEGVNVIVVEAVDPAGNITYQSELVHALF